MWTGRPLVTHTVDVCTNWPNLPESARRAERVSSMWYAIMSTTTSKVSPSKAASKVARSLRSPVMTRTLGLSSKRCGVRPRLWRTTSSPRAISAFVIAVDINPVPPSSRIFIVRTFITPRGRIGQGRCWDLITIHTTTAADTPSGVSTITARRLSNSG